MNKKAQGWEQVSDVFLGGTLILIAVGWFIIITSFHDVSLEQRMEEGTSELNNDDVLVSILNSRADKRTFTEWIILAHQAEDTVMFEDRLDEFLGEIYQFRVCWDLYKGEEKWIEKNECADEEELLDSTADIPLPDRSTLTITLNVKGYSE